ncbi:PREDICTED: B2 protein-like isoform X2 [Ipomoea nil]|uniref:B2 protein-like isoform X2 n=1 Tax=Ipomoea nil TaxID=35883 RepID=UPI000901F713|nr:PREDICTED: B2 protein-like isoform X2 [Ipomoea nil]
MENAQSSFRNFSDRLRLQPGTFTNLSLNDSIWSTSYSSKRPEERRNLEVNSDAADYALFGNDGWKVTQTVSSLSGSAPKEVFGSGLNGGFNKGIYPSPAVNFNSYSKGINNKKGGKFGLEDEKCGKKNKNVNKDISDKNGVDKRFKTLPPSEALPRNETVGGYIFVCNNDTMEENLRRQLFGLPPRYRDSVRQITPGLPLFLYNYSTHQLHGIFEAASFGGTNIDPSAWEDKKNPGESRFPAQVRVVTRKVCEPLEEDAFRPILHHYDGPKFRLELNIPETLSLLDIFAENNP